MSLINDALKKAARQRAQEQGDYTPPMPGGGRGSPSKGPNYLLIGGAAVALVVVSVVLTGLFVNKGSEPKPVIAAPTLAPIAIVPKAPSQAVAPIQLTVPTLPESTEAKAPAQVAVRVEAPTPAPVVAAAPTAVPTRVAAASTVQPAPVATAPAAATPAPVVIESQGDRIQTFIDALQVSGVRYAGAESKAIIGGHIYRVNDVLDRALGLRLRKVDTDHLTFVDASGATYVKTF